MLDRLSALTAIRTALRERASVLQANADVARDEATHEDSRAENKYDTRAIEAGYLAGAQAKRARDAAADAAWFEALPDAGPGGDAVRGPALVALEDDDGVVHHYFVAARAGGLRVDVGDTAVRVVTLDAPLGRALVGAEVDDDVEVDVGAERRSFVLLRID